ncbi:hypothetical protein BGY98DRAFT_1094275 [Russula aff. rugulosa BPL654]|nr:hypothetical protein BGY98DRAFT_1094275 [Russula aff. rugulosa BPL654]
MASGQENFDREMHDVFSPAPFTSRRRGDTSAMFSVDGDFDSSPGVSPSRPFQAPDYYPSNEVEALQQRLACAQRQIKTLKGTLQREKELKIEYRKRLDVSLAVWLNTRSRAPDPRSHPAPLSASPGPIPEPVLTVAPEFPKLELKEISIQSEKWASTPASPAHPRDTSLLEFKAADTGLSSSKLYWTDGTNSPIHSPRRPLRLLETLRYNYPYSFVQP